MKIKHWVRCPPDTQYKGDSSYHSHLKYNFTFPEVGKMRTGAMCYYADCVFTLDRINMAYPTAHYYWTVSTGWKYRSNPTFKNGKKKA